MKTFFFIAGIIFCACIVLGFVIGAVCSISSYNESERQREYYEKLRDSYIKSKGKLLDDTIVEGGETMINKDLTHIAETLSKAERTVNEARNLAKSEGCMTITLESKFSNVLVELDRIRKTFVSLKEGL